MPGPYPTRPMPDVVRAILEHIRDTGEPHTDPRCDHTCPAEVESVVYLAEYDLPPSHSMPDKWARCPICSPERPKYWRRGKVAWFPAEGVIRCIGGDCFRTLIGDERHEAALAQLRREERERNDAAFVAEQVPAMRGALPILDERIALAQGIDAFRGRLFPRMAPVLDPRALWARVRGGDLNVVAEIVLPTRDGGERRTQEERRIGGLEGHQLLEPPPPVRRLAPDLEAAVGRLRQRLDSADLAAEADPDRRSAAIRSLNGAWQGAAERAEVPRAWRRFIDLANVRTLRAWARRPDATLRATFDLRGATFVVGDAEGGDLVEVVVPAVMLAEPRPLPDLGVRRREG